MNNRAYIPNILAWTFALGVIGSAAELLLLEHTEDVWQFVPIALLGLGLLGFIAVKLAPTRTAETGFRAVLLAFLVSGPVGIWRHVKGNMEFEVEMYPDLAGFPLLWESLAGATPALAPATMMLLGIVGWVYLLARAGTGSVPGDTPDNF